MKTIVTVKRITLTPPDFVEDKPLYIQRPDGKYDYPLFFTDVEAKTEDLENLGAGISVFHQYANDPTYSSWYSSPMEGAEIGSLYPPEDIENYAEIPTT